jgi:probable phosphoglycerate mutase
MATVLLIRHAEHEVGMDTLVGRTPQVRLSALGRTQAADLSARLAGLPIEAVYASPLERTVETATVIALPHRLPVQTCDELVEVDFGDWTGMKFRELRERADWNRWNAASSLCSAPHGEFLLAAQMRAVKAILEIAERHPQDACIAAVSHGDIIRAATAHFLGVPLDQFIRIEISLASVTVLNLSSGEPRLICVNNTGAISLKP